MEDDLDLPTRLKKSTDGSEAYQLLQQFSIRAKEFEKRARIAAKPDERQQAAACVAAFEAAAQIIELLGNKNSGR